MTNDTPSRRDIVAGGIAAATLFASPSPAINAIMVEGKVLDGTGRETDPGSVPRGIPGIQISNGRDIAITDAQGRWRLPVKPGGHVCVIKPDDWSLPRRENGLTAHWRSIEDAMSASSLDFMLYRDPEPRRFSVALLADTQPQCGTELGYLRDTTLPAVTEAGAAFAINHGDVVFDCPDLYARYLDLAASTGIPWHHCPGNHDMNAGSPRTCFDDWMATFGPCHYAFHYGGATFILLNNVERLPKGELTAGGYGYRGHIGREQLHFVSELLARTPLDRLVVVSMHIPLVTADGATEPASLTADRAALLALLSGRPNTLSLAGHTHTTEHHYIGAPSGFAGPGLHHHHVLTTACGSWWSGPYDNAQLPVAMSCDGTPKGFHMLDVTDDTYTTRFVPVGHAGHPQMRIALVGAERDGAACGNSRLPRNNTLAIGDCSRTSLTVNVFDGGPRTRVTCRLVRRGAEISVAALNLVRDTAPDATAADLFQRHRPQVKGWVEATTCTHLWSGPLPQLLQGTYTATVDVVDQYGRQHTSAFLFEVVA